MMQVKSLPAGCILVKNRSLLSSVIGFYNTGIHISARFLLYGIIIIIIDRFSIALFSALEQTHCARM